MIENKSPGVFSLKVNNSVTPPVKSSIASLVWPPFRFSKQPVSLKLDRENGMDHDSKFHSTPQYRKTCMVTCFCTVYKCKCTVHLTATTTIYQPQQKLKCTVSNLV
jgi:hypothetical protein